MEDKKESENKQKMIERLEFDSNLARIAWPLRVIDSEGKVHAWYDPDHDMRFPGQWQYQVPRLAYKLWEEAGKPEGDGKRFWYEAESQLKKMNGVFYPLRATKAPTSKMLPLPSD